MMATAWELASGAFIMSFGLLCILAGILAAFGVFFAVGWALSWSAQQITRAMNRDGGARD
jgi:hypothetical protein